MEIVPMEPDHYDALVKLWSSFPGNSMTGADSLSGFLLFLQTNGEYCFSAFSDGLLAGSVMAGHDSRRGYVYHLAVREDLQGQGLGRALMESCERALIDAGIEKIHLFIYSDNSAVEFYRKAGWHLRSDIEVMSKVLHGDKYTGTRMKEN